MNYDVTDINESYRANSFSSIKSNVARHQISFSAVFLLVVKKKEQPYYPFSKNFSNGNFYELASLSKKTHFLFLLGSTYIYSSSLLLNFPFAFCFSSSPVFYFKTFGISVYTISLLCFRSNGKQA